MLDSEEVYQMTKRKMNAAQIATAKRIHTRCISIDPVAHAAAFMLHTEVLNLMSVLL